MCATAEEIQQTNHVNLIIEFANTAAGVGLTTLDAISDGFVTHLTTVWNGGNRMRTDWGQPILNQAAAIGNDCLGMGIMLFNDMTENFHDNLAEVIDVGFPIPLEATPICPPGTPPESCDAPPIPGDPG